MLCAYVVFHASWSPSAMQQTPEVSAGGAPLSGSNPAAARSSKEQQVSSWHLLPHELKKEFQRQPGAKAKCRWIIQYCCENSHSGGSSKLWSINPRRLFSYTGHGMTQRSVHDSAIKKIAGSMRREGLYDSVWKNVNEDVFCIRARHPEGRCECCTYWNPDACGVSQVCAR